MSTDVPQRLGDELNRLLDDVDVVSFDVFDTALVRQVERPTDVFLLLAGEAGIQDTAAFTAERIRAEAQARDQAWRACQAVEVNLQDIYACLQFSLPEGLTKAVLAEQERQLELRIARPREWVRAFYRQARLKGRKVGFVSDMYLDAGLIGEMLHRAGYEKPDFLLVSSEVGETKAAGGLYRELLSRLDVPPARVLHLGDNRHADLDRASRAGLQARWLPKCAETFSGSKLGKRFARVGILNAASSDSSRTLWTSLWRGLVAARQDSYRDDFWFSLGYSHAGPLLLGFTLWLQRRAQADGITGLYFLARDGHIVHRIHGALAEHGADVTAGTYLHASRRALNIPALTRVDEAACDFLVSGSSVLTAGEFIARVGLDPRECLEALDALGLEPDSLIDSGLQYGRLRALFRSLEDQLLAHAARERVLLHDYFGEQGVFGQSHLGLVDIGWHGSMQTSFCALLDAFGGGPDVTGYYLGTFHAARQRVEAGARQRAYLCELGEPAELWRLIRVSVEIFEWLFCAPHGSVCGFSRAGSGVVPLFDGMDAEQLRHETAERMQAGVIAFVQDCLSAFPKGVVPPVPEASFAVAVLGEMLRRPSIAEAELLGEIPHAEGFGGAARVRPLARPPVGAHLPWRWGEAVRGWRQSFWRPGYRRRLLPWQVP